MEDATAVEVKTHNNVLKSRDRLDKQSPMSLDKWSFKTREGEQNRLCVLHQFTFR